MGQVVCTLLKGSDKIISIRLQSYTTDKRLEFWVIDNIGITGTRDFLEYYFLLIHKKKTFQLYVYRSQFVQINNILNEPLKKSQKLFPLVEGTMLKRCQKDNLTPVLLYFNRTSWTLKDGLQPGKTERHLILNIFSSTPGILQAASYLVYSLKNQ